MKTILFVDDSEDTRDLIKLIFCNEGEITVHFASNSKEAINLFNENSYNACILDVSLPDLTGYYLGNLIRNSCPDMPIAFLTNYDGDFTKENAQFLNAKFWSKPEVFQDMDNVKNLIMEECLEISCGNKGDIAIPELIKEMA